MFLQMKLEKRRVQRFTQRIRGITHTLFTGVTMAVKCSFIEGYLLILIILCHSNKLNTIVNKKRGEHRAVSPRIGGHSMQGLQADYNICGCPISVKKQSRSFLTRQLSNNRCGINSSINEGCIAFQLMTYSYSCQHYRSSVYQDLAMIEIWFLTRYSSQSIGHLNRSIVTRADQFCAIWKARSAIFQS